MTDAVAPPRPGSLILVALGCIVGGALLGGLTNAINGQVSPEYFRQILDWDEETRIGRAAIAQGIFEGLVYGVLFALVFTLVVGWVSSGRCPFPLAGRYLLAVMGGILACWGLGGLLAMTLAMISPDFYRQAFRGVPEEFPAMLRYAWVGGSIWGALAGGMLSAMLASVLFAARWGRSQDLPSNT